MSIIILFAMSIASARESLYEKPKVVVQEGNHSSGSSPARSTNVRSAERLRSSVPSRRSSASSALLGNLDSEILVISKYRVEDSNEITPKEKVALKFIGLKTGEVLSAEITEELVVYPDSKVPVRVIVSEGKLKGAILLGEATLEKNSKKVQINFKKFRTSRSEEVYQIEGYSLVGGKHHTNEGKFFLAEFLAAGVAGFADSTIERNQNAYGNYVDAPTFDTSAKKGAVSALSKVTERLAEKQRSAPEYTVVSPLSPIEVLIAH